MQTGTFQVWDVSPLDPRGRGVGGVSQGQAAGRTGEADGDLGRARRVEEAGKRRREVVTGAPAHGGHEIGGRGVLVGVRREVDGEAAAERFGADPALEHAQDRRALLVGDAVEGVGDVALALDRLADLARGDAGVGVETDASLLERLVEGVPLGVHLLGDADLDPRRERLVQPDVIPPGGGDEVAEPLMTGLVGDERHEPPPEADVLLGRSAQDDVGGAGDHAGVLHGSLQMARADEIELGIRVGRAEEMLELVDDRAEGRPWGAGLVGEPARHDDAERDAALGVTGVEDLERPDGEGDEIRRQRTRLAEDDAFRDPVDGLRFDGRVRHRDEILGDAQGQSPRVLVARLVETGKHPARVGRFELGVDVAVGALFLEVGAGRILGREHALPAQVERGRAGTDGGRQGEADEVIAARNDARRAGVAAGRDLGNGDLQVLGVQPENPRRARKLELDGLLAREVGRRRVERQLERRAQRPHVVGEAERRWRCGRGRNGGDGRRGRRSAARSEGSHEGQMEGWAHLGRDDKRRAAEIVKGSNGHGMAWPAYRDTVAVTSSSESSVSTTRSGKAKAGSASETTREAARPPSNKPRRSALAAASFIAQRSAQSAAERGRARSSA
jgi:hypothetical protein